MVIDRRGFRRGVALVLVNQMNKLFWAHRLQGSGWQFPQGGLQKYETPNDAMYRELHEEVGLLAKDVEIIATTKHWLQYRLPPYLIRANSYPVCVGQKQKWFLLRFIGEDKQIRFNVTNRPEFDNFRWVQYWYPTKQVVYFKRDIYRRALKEFSPLIHSLKKDIASK